MSARRNPSDEFKGTAKRITEHDFENAAQKLGCEVAAVKAVVKVEAGRGGGFLLDKRPKILFESRWFHKLTNAQYDNTHPHLSTPTWVRNYIGGSGEYARLEEAIKLNRQAALKASSWGSFQILGVNFRLAGFNSVERFVKAQVISEGEHLKAFVNFVRGNSLDDELRDKRWADFAKRYNGPGYKQNRYDEKMAAAYEEYSEGIVYPTTLEIQLALNLHGASLDADGITGPNTRKAIEQFQRSHGLIADGISGKETLAALDLVKAPDPVALSNSINATD